MIYEGSLTREEKVGSLFQPDPILPAQYLETFQRKTLSPEKRLMLAVLEDAVMCFQKYALAQNGKGKRLFCEADDWILEENGDWLFSFENVCAAFGLDPNYIRQGLTRAKSKLRSRSLEPEDRCIQDRAKKTRKKRKYRVAA
jgi:hypothetical protein